MKTLKLPMVDLVPDGLWYVLAAWRRQPCDTPVYLGENVVNAVVVFNSYGLAAEWACTVGGPFMESDFPVVQVPLAELPEWLCCVQEEGSTHLTWPCITVRGATYHTVTIKEILKSMGEARACVQAVKGNWRKRDQG